MRAILTLIFNTMLVGLPLPSVAEVVQETPSGAPEAPFDEYDPAVMQAEIERQVLEFLQSVQSRWGQSQDALRQALTGRIERDDQSTLVYTRRFSEHTVLEGYNFLDGLLVRGQYLCLQRPVNDVNEFVEYYAALKQSLIALYGVPAEDRMEWENDTFKALPDYWGVAIMMNHLHLAAIWELPEGSIALTLTGNRHSQLTIDFKNRTFSQRERFAGLPALFGISDWA